MSLSAAERRATSDELQANLALSGRSTAEVAADLGLDAEQVRRVLAVDPGSRPELVWLLRDHLDATVRASGREPHPWSTLTDAARAAAATWFPLRQAPAAERPRS